MTIDMDKILARFADVEIGTPMEDGRLFDNIFYLTNNIDVLESEFHPYEHFIISGRIEGREFKIVDPSLIPSDTKYFAGREFPKDNETNSSFDRNSFARLVPTFGSSLEIGPFAAPLLSGDFVRFADVFDTAKLRSRAEEIGLDTTKVPRIEFVVQPNDLSSINTKFESVLSSHCIEHQPDLLGHLIQVANLLEKEGRYFLLIPDHRYCFDHFQTPSTIADVLAAHQENRHHHTFSTVIRHNAFTTHNNAIRHWAGDHTDEQPALASRIHSASQLFDEHRNEYLDCHAWYFTPESWSETINLLSQLGLIEFEIERLYETRENQLEFWTILRKLNT
jgi:hypothetical protein